jgi:hypothetical protein
MKKFKLLITSLFLAMALLFVNISPVRASSDDPQGTSQKKAPPPQIPAELVNILLTILRSI